MKTSEKIILSITGASHLSVHGLMLVFPNILLVLQKQFNAGLDVLGFIAAASAFMFGLGAIPAGYLESRLGGRTLLLTYQCGTVLAVVWIILSSTLVMITVGLMLLGLFSSIYHPAGLTIISRRIENISKGMAIHGIAGSLGLAISPILAAALTVLFSWRFAYGTLAVFNLILAAGTMFLIKPGQGTAIENDLANTESTNKPALTLYYGIAVIIGLSFAGFTTFMPTHFALQTRELFGTLSDTLRGGIFTTVVLLAGVIGQTIGGHLGSRYNRATVLFWIIVSNIPFMALLGFFTGVPLILSGIILGIVHFNFQPVGNSLVAQFTHSQDRGIGYGISFFLSFGVGSIAAGLSGIIAEKFGVALVFPAMALVLIPGVILAWWLKRIVKHEKRLPTELPLKPGDRQS